MKQRKNPVDDESMDNDEVMFRVFFKGQTQFERPKPFHIRIPGGKCTWSKTKQQTFSKSDVFFVVEIMKIRSTKRV